jgi:hypothetical protein
MTRQDAPRRQATLEELSGLGVEALMEFPTTGHAMTDAFCAALAESAPHCCSIADLASQVGDLSVQDAVAICMSLLQLGMIRLRLHLIHIETEMPSHPQLSKLNLDHLASGKPIVDAFHRPCLLSTQDRAWLMRCDGSHSFEALMKSCSDDAQRAALHEMLSHLLQRGLLIP